MSTSTGTQPSSSPQSTKSSNQPTYSTDSNPSKSTYRILKDAGFRSMNDFMFSHGLKLHDDEHLEQAKEMIERMKEEDLMGEDLRRLEFRAANDEGNVKDQRGTESSEDDDDVVELIGFLEVVSDEEEEDGIEESIEFADVVNSDEVDDGFQVSGVEIVEELDRVSSREEEPDECVDVDVDVGMVDDNVGEDFDYEDFGGGDDGDDGDDGYDDFEDDFDDDFDDDFFYDA
ncbi:uncharacterized protein EAE98_003179 [Botrytis deweyae]|uniref:Uncharacterized protein n=1 Tax=Botrytis deweyae TaxID=2478750 RepID=A0ABQ7IVT8_9HELO|nr:uncharacterized protein EAE98_003179 [Botrytis deweyae]KAF7935134.1 hypothetical protein EAE98_003179 [Botrytis deweyae]